MKNKSLAYIICAAAMLLQSCASLFPKDYDPASGGSLIVIADEEPSYGGNIVHYIKIDTENNLFVGDLHRMTTIRTSFFKISDKVGASGASFSLFSAKKQAYTYDEGRYAVIAYGNSERARDGSMYGAELGKTKCYNKRAATFYVGKGEIVILPTPKINATKEQLLSDFENARKDSPEIQGKARVADFDKHISFELMGKSGAYGCAAVKDNAFTILEP